MAFRRALLASAIVLSPVATGAQAQSDRSKVPPPVSGAYVKGSVGPNLLADQKSNGLRVKAKGVGVQGYRIWRWC